MVIVNAQDLTITKIRQKSGGKEMKGGLQACSVTDKFLEDTYGTLKKIAGYGYKYIESAGTMFTPALKTDMKELRKMMDELGIEHPSKHYCPYLTSDLDKEIKASYYRRGISGSGIRFFHRRKGRGAQTL